MSLNTLKSSLSGSLHDDDLVKSIYATDASVYRMLPLAVVYPKHAQDIKRLIAYAKQHQTSLIPRTAGTSLAGQCVGSGIVVDVSKNFNNIVSLDKINRTVTVQPGVVRDVLNQYLKPFGLFFAPNTSTSNRCMIGGMVGNNSSGTTSIQYGVTRDKVIEIQSVLSDGSEVVFGALSAEEFHQKLRLNTLEGSIYNTIFKELKSKKVQERITDTFPKPEIHRRNTGYAIDELIKTDVFSNASEQFNMCKLLSGSEGTLAFTTQITLQLDLLPPQESIMVAIHFDSIEKCLNSVALVMTHSLYTCEMMDKTILDCTKHNKTQQENRAFITGDPKAILMCELKSDALDEVTILANNLIDAVHVSGLSYAISILKGSDIDKANHLRSAGLGLLGNIVGDKKAVACIEDTAVALPDLANYIAEFSALMSRYKQEAIYYAHAGAGELHLRPVLNIKKSEDVILFRKITKDVAHLVKKYNGSMSGEHGDGIVRSEYIAFMIGQENYEILKQLKKAFDPNNIFNPGKIIDAVAMDKNLRYQPDRVLPEVETILDFSKSQGILREAEKCNGSGDCRKLSEFGGTMCPSYRATLNEKDTTRARANALREFLTTSTKTNKFNHKELKDVFDLCLSCKACRSECPSSVDVANLKAEFLYQYQNVNGYALKDRFFAYASTFNRLASKSPALYNSLSQHAFLSKLIKRTLGIHTKRSLPKATKPFKQENILHAINDGLRAYKPIKTIYFFVDEFTNYLESQIIEDALHLLTVLNYKVIILNHFESGRSHISKGFLKQAKKIVNDNISVFRNKISEETPLVGVEPSAIYTFKDEYLKLADDKIAAKDIAKNTLLIEEFIHQEIELGHITPQSFTTNSKVIKFHGHCYQKALHNQLSSFAVLNLPKNYKVTIIPSGCCGMAGSFGYEKEHYPVSMKIGEQTLFPAIRNTPNTAVISANGTSCRHQIKDGTQREAKHPISILKEALI